MFFLTAARKTGARRGGFCRRARVQVGALFLPHRLWGKRCAPLFKPQGNSIIPKRKFVMTFQKRRARRGAPFCARRGAKSVNKKRRGRVYAGRGKRRSGGSGGHCALRALSAALSLRSVLRRGAWLCSTIRARGFCRACFFLTAARKTRARRGGSCRRARARPAGAPFCARRYAKAVSKKRRDRVYVGRGKRCGRLGSVSAVLSSCQLCAHICFAHNFGGAG